MRRPPPSPPQEVRGLSSPPPQEVRGSSSLPPSRREGPVVSSPRPSRREGAAASPSLPPSKSEGSAHARAETSSPHPKQRGRRRGRSSQLSGRCSGKLPGRARQTSITQFVRHTPRHVSVPPRSGSLPVAVWTQHSDPTSTRPCGAPTRGPGVVCLPPPPLPSERAADVFSPACGLLSSSSLALKRYPSPPPREVRGLSSPPPQEVRGLSPSPPQNVSGLSSSPPQEVRGRSSPPPQEVRGRSSSPPQEVRGRSSSPPQNDIRDRVRN